MTNLLKMPVMINAIDPEFHCASNFREQVAVLFPAAFYDGNLVAHRSFLHSCLPGRASFDAEKPGEDTLAGWQYIDGMIDDHGVCGMFHTHPSGCIDWSGEDKRLIHGFAKAHGKKILWHVMQPLDHPSARCVAAHMPINGHVVIYDFGYVESSPTDTAIVLPAPPAWEHECDIHTLHIS